MHLGTRLISTATVLDDSNFTILESILVHTEARECAILSHSQELSQLLARCNIQAHSGPTVSSLSKSYSTQDMLKYVQATHQHEARMELEKESRVQQALGAALRAADLREDRRDLFEFRTLVLKDHITLNVGTVKALIRAKQKAPIKLSR